MSGEVNKIGIDVDSHDGYGFMYIYVRACRFGCPVVYYTRHGFHMVVELWGSVSIDDSLLLRRIIGDCPDRLAVDESRVERGCDLARHDTLFEVRLKGGETYKRREIRPLACGPFPYEGDAEVKELGCPEGGSKDWEKGFGYDLEVCRD